MKSLMPQIDSNDGLFHNGNPATGEQGTRVTDTWLNNLQDRVRDVQTEAHYVLQKAGFTPKEETQTQLYQAIVKIIDDNRKTASLTQKGETKLYTGYDSQSEDLALTPKTAYQLKQLIDSNTRALGNVIPNSKKSSAVNSNSSDTVATSAAVKIAYDKGVDAKTAADNAQRTANDGVSKADAAQRTANDGVSKANAAQTSANQAKSAADAAQSSANAANNNANGRILKTDISHATNGTNKAKVASEFAVGELARSFTHQKIGDIEVRKYPDGTMIQTCRKHMLTGDYSKVNFNWAVAFTEMPILTATAQYYNSVGDHDTIITFVQGTSNSACHLVCGETYNNSGEIAYVNIIAIGRWKR